MSPSFPLIDSPSVFNFPCGTSGYCYIIFFKGLADNTSGTYRHFITYRNVTKQLRSRTYPAVVPQLWRASSERCSDVHTLMDITKFADAASAIYNYQAIMIDTQTIIKYITRNLQP